MSRLGPSHPVVDRDDRLAGRLGEHRLGTRGVADTPCRHRSGRARQTVLRHRLGTPRPAGFVSGLTTRARPVGDRTMFLGRSSSGAASCAAALFAAMSCGVWQSRGSSRRAALSGSAGNTGTDDDRPAHCAAQHGRSRRSYCHRDGGGARHAAQAANAGPAARRGRIGLGRRAWSSSRRLPVPTRRFCSIARPPTRCRSGRFTMSRHADSRAAARCPPANRRRPESGLFD